MKTTLTTIAIVTILLSAGFASADETTSTRPAAARSVVRAQRSQAARTARTARAAAPAPSASTSLIRGFGSCDAASFEELAAEIGRLAAMEDCTSRGNPTATARELSRSAPRQTDLGIPEEAFDAGFEVSGL